MGFFRRLLCAHQGHSVEWERKGNVIYYDARCPDCGKEIPLPDAAAQAMKEVLDGKHSYSLLRQSETKRGAV